MLEKRHTWIDVARGIGIFLIIYGHILDKNSYRYLLYSFHIPLFFFLSGTVFKFIKNQPFTHFLRKNVFAILSPYLGIAFIQWVIWVILFKDSYIASPEVLRQLVGILYGSGSNGLLAFNSVLWFLPALFVTRLLFFIVSHFINTTKNLMVTLLCFSLFGYFFSTNASNIKLPFQLESAFTAIVFFGLGYLFMQAELAKNFTQKYGKYFLFFLVFLCVASAASNYQLYGHQIDLRLDRLDNYFLFYLSALTGTFSIVVISMELQKQNILAYVGKKSFILFVWHPFVFPLLPSLLPLLANIIHVDHFNIILPTFYSIICISIILGMQLLYQKIVRSFFPSFSQK